MAKKTAKEEKEQFIKICPKCKSTNIRVDNFNPLNSLILPTRYICSSCGNAGNIFPEIPVSKLKEVQKEKTRATSNESSGVDVRIGVFEIKVFWKIFAPMIFLVGVFFMFSGSILIGAISIAISLLMFYFAYFKKIKYENL